MFYQLIQHKRDEWYASSDCTVGDMIAYIVRQGMMRDAQIEAIKTYLYLKIACGNRPLWKLYHDGGASFTHLEIKDGVSLFRNPQQTNDKLMELTGVSRSTQWGDFWQGSLTDSKLGPHKGEEMYVMKVDYLMPTKEIKDALNATPVRVTCWGREGNEVKRFDRNI